MAKLDQLAIVSGESFDGQIDGRGELFVLQGAVWRDAVVRKLALFARRLLVSRPEDGNLTDALLTQRVDGAVLCNPEEPCRKLVLRIVAVEREKHLHENFLCEIMSILVAMGDAIHVVDDPFFVPFQDRKSTRLNSSHSQISY